MRIFPLAFIALLVPMVAPIAGAIAQSTDQPVVLMTLEDVEREKAERAEREAEIARKKAECASQVTQECWGLTLSFGSDADTADQSAARAPSFGRVPTERSTPTRATQADQDADVDCKLEQARRDREYVSGEGPVCRAVRLAREGAADGSQYRVSRPASQTAAPNRESNCRKLADGSTQCGWSKTTTRRCETQADGTESCTTSTSSGISFGRDD